MVFVTIMLLLPSANIPSGLATLPDYVVHACIMAIGAFLWYWGRFRLRGTLSKKVFLRVVGFFLVYSVLTEFIQAYLIAGRSGTVSDVIADMTGVLTVSVIVFALTSHSRNNN